MQQRTTMLVYTAQVLQNSTSDPTAIILANGFPFQFQWSRMSAGVYQADTGGYILNDETTLFAGATTGFVWVNKLDSQTIQVESALADGTLTDGLLNLTMLEIREYHTF